jgi:preprotein translocase subunit YajC
MTFISKIITIDSKIWNQTEVCADICFAMSKNLDIIICCNYEGPDIRWLGLDKFIESQSQRYGYDLGKILIRSDNLIEKYDSVLVQKKFPKHLMKYSLDYDHEIIKCRDPKHFGLFIGKNNAPRLFLGAYLYKKYKDQTQMLSKLSINDKVVTVGGAIGTISDIKDDIITIKFHDSKIDFYQSSITKNLTQEEKKNAKK